MGQWLGRLIYLGNATSLEKKNFEFKPVLICLKINLVSNSGPDREVG